MAETGDTTVIAAETHIKGELIFEGEARVLGTVEGKILAKGNLVVAERGVCRAQIEADNIQVDGSIEGDVIAGQRLQLSAQGRIKGDIVAEKLVTAEGASINGHVSVGVGAKDDNGKPQAARARQAEPVKQVAAAAVGSK